MTTYDPEKVEALIEAANAAVRGTWTMDLSPHLTANVKQCLDALKPPQEPELEHVMPEWWEILRKNCRSTRALLVAKEILIQLKDGSYVGVSESVYNALREATRRPKQTQGKLPEELTFGDLHDLSCCVKSTNGSFVHVDDWCRVIAHLKKKYNV